MTSAAQNKMTSHSCVGVVALRGLRAGVVLASLVMFERAKLLSVEAATNNVTELHVRINGCVVLGGEHRLNSPKLLSTHMSYMYIYMYGN